MAVINDLPGELLSSIVSYAVPKRYKPKKILRIALVSWKFYFVTIPFLYSWYCHRVGQPSNRFLLRLLQHNALARHVRTLWIVHSSRFTGDFQPEDLSIEDKSELDLILPILMHPCTYNEEYNLGLIIDRTPNLTTLHIHESTYYPRRAGIESVFIIRTMLAIISRAVTGDPANTLSHNFKSLRSLYVNCRTGQSPMGLELALFSNVVRLPSLRFFRADRAIVLGEWVCPKGAASVETLVLRDSGLSILELAPVIMSIKALKVFRYNYVNSARRTPPETDLALIRPAINRHKDTLEFFWIDDAHDLVDSTTSSQGPTLGPLREFEKLKDIKLPLSALANGSISHDGLPLELPLNLEHLRITVGPHEEPGAEDIIPILLQLGLYLQSVPNRLQDEQNKTTRGLASLRSVSLDVTPYEDEVYLRFCLSIHSLPDGIIFPCNSVNFEIIIPEIWWAPSHNDTPPTSPSATDSESNFAGGEVNSRFGEPSDRDQEVLGDADAVVNEYQRDYHDPSVAEVVLPAYYGQGNGAGSDGSFDSEYESSDDETEDSWSNGRVIFASGIDLRDTFWHEAERLRQSQMASEPS